MHFRILIHDFPIGGNGCQSWRTNGRLYNEEQTFDRSVFMSHRGSGNRESGGCVFVDIANREIPMERMVKGIWWWSLESGPVKGLARKAHRGSGSHESREHKHHAIANAETLMGFDYGHAKTGHLDHVLDGRG